MRRKTLRKFSSFVVLIFFVLLGAVTLTAQENLPPVHHAPDREFHTVNIDLNLRFNMQKKELFGKVVEKIVPLRVSLDTVRLDAVDMAIEKVALLKSNQFPHEDVGESQTGFRYDGKTLSISLGKSYGLHDTITYSITYSTFPKKGVYFVEADSAYPDRTPQVWSQSEMEDARYWFPCHDYPDDFLTSSVTISVPEDWTVVSNGILEQETLNHGDSTRTFKWVESKPHVIYLISFVAGKYSVSYDHYGKIPIYYYVAPEYAKYVKEDFSRTPDILKFFSGVTGYEYPWQKLSLAAVTDFTFGGMENVSAITLTDRTMHSIDAEPQISSTDLISHETAHQWFGDLLTCRSWSQAWLNEGFATYFEALYGEHAFGEDHFKYEMYRDHQQVISADNIEPRPTVYNRYYDPVDLFGTYIYQRGASILHMLRGIIGKDLFFKAIKYYVHKYQHYNVDSHDFANAVREATGYNLDWFFDEWLYKPGHPVFNVDYSYDDVTHLLTLHVLQTQKSASHSPWGADSLTNIYRMPVEVLVVIPSQNGDPHDRFGEYGTKSQELTEKIWVDSLSNTYTFRIPRKPLLVEFDKGDYLLKELTFKKSVRELSYQLEHDQNVAWRILAAEELGNSNDTTAAENALVNKLKDDNFWGVRLACARALSRFQNGKAEEALRNALEDNDPRVQVEAINGLSNYHDVGDVSILEKLYRSSRNYFVRGAALKAIVAIEGKKAAPIVEDALTQDSYEQTIRIAALSSLSSIDSSAAYEKAVEFTKYGEPSSLRLSALNEVVQLRPKSEETLSLLKGYLNDPYIWIRMVAINSLGRIGDKGAIPLLLEREKLETDGRLKEAARRAVETLIKDESGFAR
jgi:aminopeptidase N